MFAATSGRDQYAADVVAGTMSMIFSSSTLNLPCRALLRAPTVGDNRGTRHLAKWLRGGFSHRRRLIPSSSL
jgi:hypothetical protein